MKGYKAFNPGMICRGKQYAENTVFEEDNAEICKSGIHFCRNPFDVLDHYPLVDDKGNFSDFAEVEALGDVKTDDNKKFCTSNIKIGAKLSFAGFVKACVHFVIENTKYEDSGSSDYSAQIGSSGDSAQIGSSVYYAQIGSSGDSAQIGSSGDYTKIGSSGDYAQIGSSGDYTKIGSSGKNSVICCAGNDSVVKAKKGSWITLAEWKWINDEYIPVCVKTEQVDGERIKEDVFYKLVNGVFTEV